MSVAAKILIKIRSAGATKVTTVYGEVHTVWMFWLRVGVYPKKSWKQKELSQKLAEVLRHFRIDVHCTREKLTELCIAMMRSRFLQLTISVCSLQQQLNKDKYERSLRRSGVLINQRIYRPISNNDGSHAAQSADPWWHCYAFWSIDIPHPLIATQTFARAMVRSTVHWRANRIFSMGWLHLARLRKTQDHMGECTAPQ